MASAGQKGGFEQENGSRVQIGFCVRQRIHFRIDFCVRQRVGFRTPPPFGSNSDGRPFRKLPARRYRVPVMRRQSAGLSPAGRGIRGSFGSPEKNGSRRGFSFCQNNEDIPGRPQPKRAASTRPMNNCAAAPACRKSWLPARLVDTEFAEREQRWAWRFWEAHLRLTLGRHQIVVRARAGGVQHAARRRRQDMELQRLHEQRLASDQHTSRRC